MKLFQLQYFYFVCKYTCMSKAADHLHVSQPSISVALKDLEIELGVSLFIRNKNKLSLTSEGEVFYQHIEHILSGLDKAIADIHKMAQDNKNLIIGIPPMLTAYTAYKLLIFKDKFERLNSNSMLKVAEIDAKKIFSMLENNEIDLALFGMEENDIPAKFKYELLWKTSLVFCAHKDHPLAKKKLISVKDINNQPIITSYIEEGFTNQIILKWFKKYGYTPNFKYAFSQVSTLVNLLCNNVGISLLWSDARVENNDLIYLNLEDNIQIGVAVFWNAILTPSSLKTKIILMLKEVFTDIDINNT